MKSITTTRLCASMLTMVFATYLLLWCPSEVGAQWLPDLSSWITAENETEAVVAECRGLNDSINCLDQRINEIFISINSVYSPEDSKSNLSYLNHQAFGSSTPVDLNATRTKVIAIAHRLKLNAEEINTAAAFPSRLIH